MTSRAKQAAQPYAGESRGTEMMFKMAQHYFTANPLNLLIKMISPLSISWRILGGSHGRKCSTEHIHQFSSRDKAPNQINYWRNRLRSLFVIYALIGDAQCPIKAGIYCKLWLWFYRLYLCFISSSGIPPNCIDRRVADMTA